MFLHLRAPAGSRMQPLFGGRRAIQKGFRSRVPASQFMVDDVSRFRAHGEQTPEDYTTVMRIQVDRAFITVASRKLCDLFMKLSLFVLG